MPWYATPTHAARRCRRKGAMPTAVTPPVCCHAGHFLSAYVFALMRFVAVALLPAQTPPRHVFHCPGIRHVGYCRRRHEVVTRQHHGQEGTHRSRYPE
ncbi:hypothetical protein NPIL_512011 [Nephila pilipes]|uniref:Uncharacterized protein n=1 Tax=Nephila pilipes TaxID=299642 RepID=A0A8X6TN66_NEPPI|nr:hypothetical protein NPIL_512011 [Nephila pilipes]